MPRDFGFGGGGLRNGADKCRCRASISVTAAENSNSDWALSAGSKARKNRRDPLLATPFLFLFFSSSLTHGTQQSVRRTREVRSSFLDLAGATLADFWLVARWPALPSGVFDPRTNPSRRTLPFASLKGIPYPRQKRSIASSFFHRDFSPRSTVSLHIGQTRVPSRVTAPSLPTRRRSTPPSSHPRNLPRPWPSL